VSRPLVIAHRGASGHRPEHTLAAYELGARMGADYIEPDLVPTRDGHLVARHENEISVTTDVAERPEFADRHSGRTIDGRERHGWFTEDFTLAELRTLRPGILTFEEVLEIARRHGTGVYPETKHPAYFRAIGLPLEDAMLAALARFPDVPAFIQSFEAGNLQALRERTDAPLVQLMREPADFTAIAAYADAVGPNKRLVDAGFVAAAHAAGLGVHPYTLGADAAEYTRFRDLGVDGVFSNFPDVALAAFS